MQDTLAIARAQAPRQLPVFTSSIDLLEYALKATSD